ncbi:GNAT family N-acetyltransferase [Tetragenococcus halophilus]|uniref:Acyltransferase n=3 Tax=Tetragenococcus TaxID=51668 RepID=A0A091C2D1_9ENTE|nr:N-acetyltransferase [Tetragenococcus halophilus]KFN91986.1 acyltransferase [Tetragenococcus muriaticus 3MR10-3]KFN92748.1 acyltransferase [Tetragenococcus muriaticus PMC-11-5]GBD64817.1 hypothetical protein TEHD23766T_2244 [Tetragenococcus halophilus subsp. flandriensis]
MAVHKIMIRKATSEDAQEIVAIYAPYVVKTTISFEQSVPDVAEFTKRITSTLQNYPYYIAQDEDENIWGYAYAGAYNSRTSYELTAEISVYVKQNSEHEGIGTILYKALEDQLKKQNVVNLLSNITAGNQKSEKFHEKHGFKRVGYLPHVGYKFDSWHDVIWMQKALYSDPTYPGRFIPFSKFSYGD